MRTRKIILLILALILPTVLQAAPESAPANPTGTAEKSGKQVRQSDDPGAPSTVPAPVFNQQVRHSDDLGQSSTVPEVKTYEELRRAISKTRAASQVRIEKAVDQEKVREAWEIGKLIDEHVLQHKERADYGKQVLQRLSNDLGMSRTELSYMLQFARAYPIFRTSEELSWGHYESLLALNDAQERDEVAAKASKEKWPVQKLREEVKKLKAGKRTGSLVEGEVPVPLEEPEPLKPSRLGQPGTYRIILVNTGSGEGELGLDLGFSIHFRLAEVAEDLSEFKEGEFVLFEEKEIQLFGKPRGVDLNELLYTYNARVTRVLDGDTMEAVIDLGFGITVTQVLRLRGIDCPELISKEGKEAKAFVENRLPPSAQILIKTSKSDKYDRYLADIFFTTSNGDSIYLNNELLEKGLAVHVRD